ncbi:OpgC family protein [Loktanella sp. M215]|uniref:OpgC family protein n=1 Tax=Loktanella sp. M215 TaxID=2675431 RepID=UPI001F1E8995|nr:OpgC domain-containing protein [Loktanella sp. M215]MCF7699700.1 OpgC domain-containing protein [Loktanella sp. M215]
MAQSPVRPDAKLIPIRQGLIAPSRPRDPRIDAFRGLALMMIVIDHMPGNPWETITVRNIGFSDAAEAFFVMSGIAAGIAYSPGLARWLAGESRLWDAMAPMWRRAWTLYTVQILLSVIALAVFAWSATTFYRAELRQMHGLSTIYEDTGGALLGLATLRYQLGYVNILPSYIVLLLAAPFVLAAGLKAPWLTLAASALLWGVAGAYGWNISYFPGGGAWFLSPYEWQIIFVVGLMIGIRHRKDQRLLPVSWPAVAVLSAFLLFVFAWRHIPALADVMNHKMAQLGALGAPRNFVSHDKTILALPRLLHILALVYVISCLPIVTRLCASSLAQPLRLMGGHGLLVFGFGTILALVGQILMDVEPGLAWLPWVLPPVAMLICYLAARVADAARSGRPPRRRQHGTTGQGDAAATPGRASRV